jgi:hypothetical protein
MSGWFIYPLISQFHGNKYSKLFVSQLLCTRFIAGDWKVNEDNFLNCMLSVTILVAWPVVSDRVLAAVPTFKLSFATAMYTSEEILKTKSSPHFFE